VDTATFATANWDARCWFCWMPVVINQANTKYNCSACVGVRLMQRTDIICAALEKSLSLDIEIQELPTLRQQADNIRPSGHKGIEKLTVRLYVLFSICMDLPRRNMLWIIGLGPRVQFKAPKTICLTFGISFFIGTRQKLRWRYLFWPTLLLCIDKNTVTGIELDRR